MVPHTRAARRRWRCRAWLSAALAAVGLASTAPDARAAAFHYPPPDEPIVSASVGFDTAAFTAHQFVAGHQVNMFMLMAPGGVAPMLDLSSEFFGDTSFPGGAGIAQGTEETGFFTAPIADTYFPVLEGGEVDLWFLLTDTGDAQFAIDTLQLEIHTATSTIFANYGSLNDGFQLGLPDGGALPGPVGEVLPPGRTTTGFDETISSKFGHTPEPATAALLAVAAAALRRMTRRGLARTGAAGGLARGATRSGE